MQSGHSCGSAIHAAIILQYGRSDHDRPAGGDQRRGRRLGGEICVHLFRGDLSHRCGDGDRDLSVFRAEEQRRSPAEHFCQSPAWRADGCGICRSLRSVPQPDHGHLYVGRADPAGCGGIPGADGRNLFAHGWGDPAFHSLSLCGKTPAASVCQHSVRNS